jgi:hypothetical protein
MALRYADRAFISVAGIELSDIQSGTLRQNPNARVVPSMTRDGKNRGFVQGNKDIDVTCVLAITNTLASPKIENIDFETNDIQITFECGADIYTATGVFRKEIETSAGGVGDEVKKTFNFGALDLIDAAGNSALFDIQI